MMAAQAHRLVGNGPHGAHGTAAGDNPITQSVQRANHFTRCRIVPGVYLRAGSTEDGNPFVH